MAAKRAFLAQLPGDPLSDYLRATLALAPSLRAADALALPRLTREGAELLSGALEAGKPVFLPAEALPEQGSEALRRSLSRLTASGLVVCPLTALPRWVQSGVSCRELLTLARLKSLTAQGFDRIYLAARPAATPLARNAARAGKICLMGGNWDGACQGGRLGVVYEEK